MDELIVLIINGIEWLFRDRSKDAARPTGMGQARPTPPPIAAGWQPRAVPPGRRPAARRRQLPPTMVALASPIVTGSLAGSDVTGVTAAAPGVARQGGGIVSTQATDVRSATSLAALKRQLTPAALRRQVIVSELLRPPLALREEW